MEKRWIFLILQKESENIIRHQNSSFEVVKDIWPTKITFFDNYINSYINDSNQTDCFLINYGCQSILSTVEILYKNGFKNLCLFGCTFKGERDRVVKSLISKSSWNSLFAGRTINGKGWSSNVRESWKDITCI